MSREVPFNKVLVANRGEIAVRIIRAARELGIETVAVYSDADRDALHVLMADEAVRLGPPEPKLSYLNMEAIIRAAYKTGAEAIHPGYGFFSENPKFTKMVEDSGLVFIGPTAEVQEKVGRKLDARKYFSQAGVPVVPGTLEPVGVDEAIDKVDELGLPVIIKPAGGGGGIGMSIVWRREEIKSAVERAVSVASSAFGDEEVYVEKYFPKARHIEVQIFGDKRGNVVHIFERECSVQRRFQKVIEEAPSPALNEELREQLTSYAVKAAKVVNYVNAGTVEFLFDPDTANFYLLEVNSRVQVEHPITEMITGVDIVKTQFIIAAGEALPFSQNELAIRGHAFEARIYAEDPLHGFVPSPGKITRLLTPAGPGVRVDSGVYEGFEVGPYYDPMLMKIITWGRNREEARKRMIRSLQETIVEGVTTNLDLHSFVFDYPRFVKGDLYTRFIEDERIIEKLKNYKRRVMRAPPAAVGREGKEYKEEGGRHVDAWSVASRLSW